MLTLKAVSIGVGFWMIIFFLPFIFNYKGWKKDMAEMVSDTKLSQVWATIFFVIGFLLLTVHYTFEKAWPVAISILGWLMILKGLVWFWFPGFVKNWMNTIMKKAEWALVLSGLLCLAGGVFYEYLGFYIF